MQLPDLKYNQTHEWVRLENNVAVIGITDHAQEQLGDVVFVNLPEIGALVKQFQAFGEVESVKAVSDLYAPLSGQVIERNDHLLDHPEVVNQSPYEQGWMIKILPSDLSEMANLMDGEAYGKMIGA